MTINEIMVELRLLVTFGNLPTDKHGHSEVETEIAVTELAKLVWIIATGRGPYVERMPEGGR